MMAILVGIRTENASGSGNSTYGYECFSISTNSLNVIKEGTKDELMEYVKKMRSRESFAVTQLDRLHNDLEFSNMTEQEYDEQYGKYSEMLFLAQFQKLMILEGIII